MVALSIPTPAVTHERAVQSGDSSRSADYRAITTQYREPLLRRSVMQLVATIVPFCVLWVAMWFSLQYSYLLVLALSVPAAGLLVRLFILQHDCGHGSLFGSKAANDGLGRALSILTLTSYGRWRKNHAHPTLGEISTAAVVADGAHAHGGGVPRAFQIPAEADVSRSTVSPLVCLESAVGGQSQDRKGTAEPVIRGFGSEERAVTTIVLPLNSRTSIPLPEPTGQARANRNTAS